MLVLLSVYHFPALHDIKTTKAKQYIQSPQCNQC